MSHLVFTNGCFDVLHAGHIHLLREASKLGGSLIVGVNTDESVRLLKGASRPINSLEHRLSVLRAIRYVDAAIPFYGTTPRELIRTLQPEVIVKGSDYRLEEVVGFDLVEEWGGRIVIIDILPGISTSSIIGDREHAFSISNLQED